jgi:hypothetical protein
VVTPALLLYAGARLGDPQVTAEALGRLRRHAWHRLRGWPGPIVPFLLGKLDASVLDRHAVLSDALAARWRCQADFWVAVRALREGNGTACRERMARCAAGPAGLLESEYHLAGWEVRRGFSDPPFG